MKLTSKGAILDVKGGRQRLADRVKDGTRIPVTITGFIVGQWGRDDGTSIEFEVDVTSVAVSEG